MQTYSSKILKLLQEKGMKLALAESCTGGLLSKLITDISGSSSVFDCGIVAYSKEIKSRLLNVSEKDLINYGPVSKEVARAMAKGVRSLASADIGLAITGIAGPNSDNTEKPVGLIYIAINSEKSNIVCEFKTDFEHNIRENNRNFAAENALKMLGDFLLS